MKTVILAGGYGTRISEESVLRPKPMVEIGGRPILWHIMKHYSAYGVNEFIICCGYKQDVIKEYFANYFLHNSDITFDFREGRNKMIVHKEHTEMWKVSVIDTGLHTMTGGRVKRIAPYLDDEPFFLTYGDGVSDVNIRALWEFHKKSGGLLTMTCVHPKSRYGNLDITEDNGRVNSFREKRAQDVGWINGGFM
ncbi:MAG: sugar phosphate nucleotidyltransferase, partial [Lachnospiraceae bacterium]|nr:sugar phosphate nucleotidyltransferase [Lachnospiraceae bacterium]